MQTTLSPRLQETTQSLIENLLASEPFLKYQQARTRLDENPDVLALLERLGQAQANVRQMQAKGQVSQAEIDSLRLLQERVQRDSLIMDYAQSQQEAVDFLRQVNGEISQLLGVNFASFANHSTC
jgi:cell fate (sporulation/competence/biofilm development) regulator YlbF (YheA/YmcA/DUF963 family)